MLTFTSRGGPTVVCDIDGKSVAAFPTKADAGMHISLLPSPQEEERNNVLSWPGEYDIDGISIRGIGHDEGKRVSYTVEAGKVRMAFLSTPLHDWNDDDLALLGEIDVLCIPADDVKIAQKIIDDVDPRVLIPIPTKDEATFRELLRIAGAQGNELVSEYKLKGTLPAEGREVVVLSPKA